MGDKKDREDQKDKKKRAILALTSLHKNLEASCSKYDTLKKWQAMVKEKLKPILDEFEDILPSEVTERLHSAGQLDTDTKEALKKACKLLRSRLAKAIHTLSPSPFALLAKALLVTGVVATAAGVFYLNSTAVDIIVKNDGCNTIYPAISKTIKLPGLVIPSAPLVSGGSMKVRVPGITASVDNIDQQTITVSLMGARMNFTLDPTIHLTFDGVELRGTQTTLQLGDKPSHNLIIACR